jgi:filamentous hemagglutinin family protein
VNSWVSAGAATLATSGNTLTVTQTTSNATYNWQTFNIGTGGVVRFDQPDETSIALNRIFQADPARILGQLSSNGRVYLLNRNGILFGQGAQVDVRGLVASSLDLSPESLQLGLARAASVGAAAFQPYSEAGVALASGAVTVEQGASIRADGGQVLIFAPQVTNRGDISTPDGQTILAAGKRIFLVASTSSDLRGLLVEVGDGGTVTNGPTDPNAGGAAALAGRISADRGNVTLAGLAVNQNGRISASTSIRANGSIRLLARDINTTRLTAPNDLTTNRTGELVLGRASTAHKSAQVFRFGVRRGSLWFQLTHTRARARVETSGDFLMTQVRHMHVLRMLG